MAFSDHISACNNHDPGKYIPFVIDGQTVGWVRPGFARELARWHEVMELAPGVLRLATPPGEVEARSRPLAVVLGEMSAQGLISPLLGELFPVTTGDRDRQMLLIDRAAVTYFGIKAFGQHINAFVRDGDEIRMWVGRRAADRIRFPGKLDHLVAGGLPWKISLERNLVKECWEEAGVPKNLALRAVSTGTVTYAADTDNGLKPDTIYCYDLELPGNFQPVCNDGEVQEFHLWPLEKVMEIVRDSEQFKLNCNLVIIDFLIRHGYIGPDEKGFTDLVTGLHPELP